MLGLRVKLRRKVIVYVHLHLSHVTVKFLVLLLQVLNLLSKLHDKYITANLLLWVFHLLLMLFHGLYRSWLLDLVINL